MNHKAAVVTEALEEVELDLVLLEAQELLLSQDNQGIQDHHLEPDT